MAGTKDIYMNFFSMTVDSGAASNALATKDFNTAAGAAMEMAWRIHMIEWFPVFIPASTTRLTIALSTRKGLSSMPNLNDKGTVAKVSFQYLATGTGILTQPVLPKVLSYLPPLIIASPRLNLYCIADDNQASMQNVEHEVRIGFTQVKLTSDVYREVFQTWNFAD